MTLTLEQLNQLPQADFSALLSGAYEQATWVAEQAWAHRPFTSIAQLKWTLAEVIRGAGRSQHLALLHASAAAQKGGAYQARFGFPFVLAPGGPRGLGLSPAEVAATLERRLGHPEDFELAESLRQLHRIAEMRLNQLLGHTTEQGDQIWDWAERLAIHTDKGCAERGELTVTYLTDAHRACAQRLSHWMRADCGFDEVAIDAVGNVVGVYHGSDPHAQSLLTGSHYDTVRNGGKYDGRLGILVPMACVRELHRQGRRLPFGMEVLGFAEEEGQRYKAVFLGSGALTGHFDPAWLEQRDAEGVAMREAMLQAGLCSDHISLLKRDASRYLGFVEVHIEQGPVLNELDLPLGIVTSINGSVRYLGEIMGMASHAGTTPMAGRRDAATATAELALFVEQRGGAVPHLVATMGMLEVPGGSINIVPGRCRFSLDIRATTNAVRDACAADVQAELQRICARRGLHYKLEKTLSAAAAPSAPAWQQRWEQAVQALGLPLHRMPSGAGHDAMMLHELMPQAMLFMRGQNAGISHNPLESITNDDAELCVRAFMNLLEQLAKDLS